MTMSEHENRPFPSRRNFISLGIGAFVVAGLPVALRRKTRLVRRTVPSMGTFAEIAVSHGNERYAQAAIEAALDELHLVEATLSWFRADSEIAHANREASRGPVPLSQETASLLDESLRWASGTEGAFDPCLGQAIELWDVSGRTVPPPRQEISDFAGQALHRHLILDRWQERTVVRFEDPRVSLDLGGIGKGYGVDRAVRVLREWGISNALVNVGGDLYALGSSPDGDDWNVGVRSPDDPGTFVATLSISDRGVATSGDYERYFDHEGRRYHHLLDPRTGEPRQGTGRSLTVAADSCTAADAGATAAFGQERTVAERMVSRVAPDAHVVHII